MAKLDQLQTPSHNGLEPIGPVRHYFEFAYSLQTPIWVFDIDSCRVLCANKPACTLWRAEDEAALCTRDFGRDMSSTVRERLQQYQTDVASGSTFKEMWTLYPNGEPHSIEVLFSGFPKNDGRFALLCEGTHHKEDLPENIRSLEALLHTDVMISLFRRNGPVLYMNPAARNASPTSQTGLASQFAEPQDYDTLIFEIDRKGEHSMVAEVDTAHGRRWHNLTAKACLDAATGGAAILVTANDVTELKNARDKARFLANRDQLTGCFNRSYLQHTVREASRSKHKKCGLLFFDIDRFKQINDRHGHEMGDIVLKALASRACAAIKKTDLLARLGGDEFVILFENAEDKKQLERVAQRLLENLRRPLVHKSVKLNPTVSMGLTFFTPERDNFTAILRQADIALYASKSEGRDRLTVYNEALGATADARDQIESDLKRAIEREEFVLHFQPRVDFASGEIVSLEALVRWKHPTRGLVMPSDFIPFCEESGLIEPVGHLVLRAGLNHVIEWHKSGLDIGVSINISPTQFDDPKLMESLVEFAGDPGFPENQVELELTENVLVGDRTVLAGRLRAIAELGYRIAIDDFGVGYSNLSYISDFPVHCIKIDRSFVDRLPESGPVVRLILTLARQIGAMTVAEGVETDVQAEWLRQASCDQAQGFLFFHPAPVERVLEHIAHGASATA